MEMKKQMVGLQEQWHRVDSGLYVWLVPHHMQPISLAGPHLHDGYIPEQTLYPNYFRQLAYVC